MFDLCLTPKSRFMSVSKITRCPKKVFRDKDTFFGTPNKTIFIIFLVVFPSDIYFLLRTTILLINIATTFHAFFLCTPNSRFIAPAFSNNPGLSDGKARSQLMSFISLLIKSAFNKPGFNGNSDLSNQIFGP